MSIKQIRPFPTRIDDDLRDYLQSKSDEQKRSLNNEIIDRLEVTKIIEKITNKPVREVINDLIKLPHLEEEHHWTKQELTKLREAYDSLKSELAKAFSLSGGTTEDIARMKIEKALNHIQSGMNELRTIFPEKDKK